MSERSARNKTNQQLANLPTYHPFIPNGEIDAILTANGFDPLAEGIYCGRDGRIHEQVGSKTWFVMSWHKMEETGRYEIVAYVS